MKTLLLIARLLIVAQGCVYTTVNTVGDEVKAKRLALLYPFKTGGFDYNAQTGDLSLKSYDTDGGGKNLKDIFEAGFKLGAKTALKGVTP